MVQVLSANVLENENEDLEKEGSFEHELRYLWRGKLETMDGLCEK